MNIKITINNSDSAKVFLASFFFFNKNNSYYVNSDIDLSFLKSIDYDLENDLSAYECVKKYDNEDTDLELVVNGNMLCVKNIEDIFEKYKNQSFADQKFFNTYTHEIEELPSTYCYTAWHLKDRITPKVIHFETMCKPFADRIDWITNMNVIDNVINDNNNVNSRILINFFYRKYLNFVLSLGKAVFRTFNLTVRVNCNGTRIRDYNKLQENF